MSHLASVRTHWVAAAVMDYQKVAQYRGARTCSSEVPVAPQRWRGLAAAVTDSAGLTQWPITASGLPLMPVPKLSKDTETQSKVKYEE